MDAMVVLMAGIADNSDVKKLVERSSMSLLRDDGVTLPPIVAELEKNAKEANAKMSKDQLNEVLYFIYCAIIEWKSRKQSDIITI